MRETNFIKQKKDKWIELERTMQQTNPDPEKLNDLYVQITDDLSYSRTFYPNRSVRVYLNGLAQQIFYSIYKNKKGTVRKLFSFWTKDLPLILYQSRWELLLGILIFWIPFIVGCLSGSIGGDEEFARQLLGDEYIDITLANISSGDPMAIYKHQTPITMFFTIFFNNVVVCFRFFMFGILFGLGSIIELLNFGLYVGSFQYFFYEQGELLQSVLGIWAHGSIEIPAAILSGVSGIVMGKGLVFPGSYGRLQAFILSARKGIQIMIGTLPLIFIAAVIESYITRLTETPDIIRAIFISFNLFVVLLYFVILPYIVGTKNFIQKIPLISAVTLIGMLLLTILLWMFDVSNPVYIALIAFAPIALIVIKLFSIFGLFTPKKIEEKEDKLQTESNSNIRFDQLKSSGEIFKDTFIVYKKNMSKIISIAFITAAIFTSFTLLFVPGKATDIYGFPVNFEEFLIDLWHFSTGGLTGNSIFIGQFFNYNNGFISPHFITNCIVYSIITYISLTAIKSIYYKQKNIFKTQQTLSSKIADFLKVSVVVVIANILLLLGNEAGFFNFLLLLIMPFLLLWAAILVLEGVNLFKGLGRAFELFLTRVGNSYLLYLILGLITIMVLMLLFSPVMFFILDNFGNNLRTSQSDMDELVIVALIYITQTTFSLIFSLVVMGFGLLYFSQMEIRDAKSLSEKIQTIGMRKRIRGLEREG